MREIRRAAVSGLFALWLSPLPALAGSLPAPSPACCAPAPGAAAVTDVVRERIGREESRPGEATSAEEA